MGEPMARGRSSVGRIRGDRMRSPESRGARAAYAPMGIVEAADPGRSSQIAQSAVVHVRARRTATSRTCSSRPRGVAKGAQRGLLVIDMSTISPVASRGFRGRLAERGIDLSTRRSAAARHAHARARSTIMVGASPEAFARAEPLLRRDGDAASSRPRGDGRNRKAGQSDHHFERHDRQRGRPHLCTTSGRRSRMPSARCSPRRRLRTTCSEWLPKTWLAGSFEGGFALDLLRKDLAAALDAARAFKLSDAGHRAGVSTLHYRSAQGDGALRLQRDRQDV